MSTADWLQAWDSCGIHRTGTAGDEAGAEWLAREAGALGGIVTIETFSFNRIDPITASIDGIPGVPVFDAPPTEPEGLTGKIDVVTLSPWAVYTPEYRVLRQRTGIDGLVIVSPGLGLLNAERYREPYGCPAIHVAEAPISAPKLLISHYQRSDIEARNVVVTIPGRDRSAAPVVVMTPRSSWWHSTSERGGGLVCWLETLRALLAAPPAGDVIMTANTGHELGHLGLDDFLARRPGWDKPGGAVWVHYGANIGAAGSKLSVHSADDALRQTAREAVVDIDVVVPAERVPNGETRDIHLAGGRYVTLVGTNRLFHLPEDRWPSSVDVTKIGRDAKGAAAMVVGLTR